MHQMVRPKTYTTLIIVITLLTATIAYLLIKNDPNSKKEYYIPVLFPNNDDCTFMGDTISKLRHYKTYKLSADTNQNRVTLSQIRVDLNAIKANKDTINGIDIVLDKKSTFQDFISCVEICREKFPEAYAACNNHIYALYSNVDTTHIKDKRIGIE